MKKIVLSVLGLFLVANAEMERVPPVKNTLYAKECGSCHFAYQPQFLDAESWKKVMGDLENHFGTDASLLQEDTMSLMEYLSHNSGRDRVGASLRISDLRWFKREHREIPKRAITQDEVKSLSNCNACHQKASSGEYSERSILIPNFGGWDD